MAVNDGPHAADANHMVIVYFKIWVKRRTLHETTSQLAKIHAHVRLLSDRFIPQPYWAGRRLVVLLDLLARTPTCYE